ncbi:MAG: glycosyltransferase family 4 protein [Acidobacteriota bacterium]
MTQTGQRLLYFLEESHGGAADYAHEQCQALAALGIEVMLLTTPHYPVRPGAQYIRYPHLLEPRPERPIANRWRRSGRYVWIKLENYRRLVQVIRASAIRHVLIGSFGEYLSPLWSPPLRRLQRQGVTFGAIIHDPVRDYVVGPLWWHRWSVGAAYAHIREAFVHEEIALDTIRPNPHLRVTVIPHGIYSYPPPTASRQVMRQQLELPGDAPVLLAFGNVRDAKNLDLVIESLKHCRRPYLVVAGRVQSAAQRPLAFYRDLAVRLGVADRCRWIEQYVPETEAANLFAASDVILLTYSRAFRSASGVLSLATHYQVPCLASSGPGPLKTLVQQYGLGHWVEPDNLQALVAGLEGLLQRPPQPDWLRFREEHSWRVNAQRIVARMFPSAGWD